MYGTRKTLYFLLALGMLLIAMGMEPPILTQAAGICALAAGEVVINEISPKVTGGLDWVELYNPTGSPRDLSYCFIDDIAGGGGAPVQIPAGTTIPAQGFWVFERSNYFNNGGDDVRLLRDDASTVLDAYSYTDPGNYDYAWYRDPDGGAWKTTTTAWPTRGASNAGSAGVCGTGAWQAGNLEIHHIDVGQGDAALIVGPTGKSLLFDVAISEVGAYVREVLGCAQVDYVLISHFHEDHIGQVDNSGLWHLVERQGFTIGQTLIRDYKAYRGNSSGTLESWIAYLETRGQTLLHPVTAVEGTGQVDLGGGVVFDILTLDGNGQIFPGDFSAEASPPSENDYSIAALLSFGDFDEWIGGDLDGEFAVSDFGYTYHDIELSVAPEAGDVDVYKVDHHGSQHSTSSTFLAQLDPEVSILSVGENNGYGHPAQSVIDSLLGTSDVYMTQQGDPGIDLTNAYVVGDVVIRTADGTSYTVNGTTYLASEPARTDADQDGYFSEVDPDDNNPDLLPSPNGGCDVFYQDCPAGCYVKNGQVVLNEILPAPSPSNGPEWVELYNYTGAPLNIGYCYLDDIAGGGQSAVEIPAGTVIPPYGYWTMDFTDYFNNTGDDVRFLKDDLSTVLDSYTFEATGYDLSWYRDPDTGAWAESATAHPTKGSVNNPKPWVASVTRAGPTPTSAASVDFSVTFSEAVTGVNLATPFQDFSLTAGGSLTGAAITRVKNNGDGLHYTVTVSTGKYNGTLRLNVVDDDTIKDADNNPLGGAGAGNGSFTSGEVYTVTKKYSSNLKSTAAQDGWILESAQNSNRGGLQDKAAATFFLGDNAQKKQYRAILSFTTKDLPDQAVITQVILKVRKQGIAGGGNPVNLFRGFMVDVKKGFFGASSGLQANDFQAGGNQSYGPFKPALKNGWYSFNLTPAKAYINKLAQNGGLTQLRLRFKLDDNNNKVANLLKLYSGNASAASRPQLIIEYYVP